MDEQVHDDMMELRQFMFDHVYRGTEAQSEEQRAKAMLRKLYRKEDAHHGLPESSEGTAGRDLPQ